jgi:hypothetical protein
MGFNSGLKGLKSWSLIREKYFTTLIKTNELLAVTVGMNNTSVCVTARIS